MIKATIDIGSNSVLLFVGTIERGKIHTKLDLCEVTSLGKNLSKTQNFEQDSMNSTFKVLSRYKRELEKLNIQPQEVFLTATEASRVAKNSKEFYLKVKNELGFDVKIISSEKEAYYAALGVSLTSKSPTFTIMDIGGASTELIRVKRKPFEVLSTISLPIGSVKATDLINEKKFDLYIQSLMPEIKEYSCEELICIAGTMTSIAAVDLELIHYDESVNNHVISRKRMNELADILNKKNEELLSDYPVLGKRAKSIYGGALIAKNISNFLKIKTLMISTSGLRHGVYLDCLKK